LPCDNKARQENLLAGPTLQVAAGVSDRYKAGAFENYWSL
jgi:hypothetical protein